MITLFEHLDYLSIFSSFNIGLTVLTIILLIKILALLSDFKKKYMLDQDYYYFKKPPNITLDDEIHNAFSKRSIRVIRYSVKKEQKNDNGFIWTIKAKKNARTRSGTN